MPMAFFWASGTGLMVKKSTTYIWQFVIGFGFLSGISTAVGINPEAVILNTLGTVTGAIYPDPTIRQLFVVLPTILLIISVYGAYKKGGVLGLVSVIIAYMAGLSVLVSTGTALILFIVAVAVGYLATSRRRR
jgi:hypothetical protein